MIGAIIGDVVGSCFEHFPIKSTEFPLLSEDSRFTDDTVLTVAVAEWLLNGGPLAEIFHRCVERYPYVIYGDTFIKWAFQRDTEPYNSWGNGSAMRVSPVAYASDSLDDVLALAKKSAEVTHNHQDGIRGAQAVAVAVYLARTGATRGEIKHEITERFSYDLNRTLDDIRPEYQFDVSCNGSVPESMIAFLESTCFEEAIRNAVSLGGDADTQACIAGALAEAFYHEIPRELHDGVFALLDESMRGVIDEFYSRFNLPPWKLV